MWAGRDGLCWLASDLHLLWITRSHSFSNCGGICILYCKISLLISGASLVTMMSEWYKWIVGWLVNMSIPMVTREHMLAKPNHGSKDGVPFWPIPPSEKTLNYVLENISIFSFSLPQEVTELQILELLRWLAIRPSYLLPMSPFRRPLLLLYLRCKISYLGEWGHSTTPFRIVFMPIRTAEALPCS